jgi:hypothetical protein
MRCAVMTVRHLIMPSHPDGARRRPNPVQQHWRAIYVARSSRTGSGVFGCAAGEYDG